MTAWASRSCINQVIWLLVWAPFAQAFQAFTNSSVPVNASIACAGSLSADLNCNPIVFAFQPGNYYTTDVLTAACTASCGSSLDAWYGSINSACSGLPWSDAYGIAAPIQTVPDLVRYNFNQTCRTDSGRYCNVVLGQAAMETNGTVGNATTACDLCSVKMLQFAAGSPYYDGPVLQSKSVYESYTSSCSISNLPLSTSTLGFTT